MRIIDSAKIIAFFNRLSKREKLFFLGAGLVIGMVVSDRLVVRPIAGTFGSLERELEDLQTEIKKSIRLLSQKERILNEVKEYAGYSVRAKSTEEETVALLKHIEELANRANVSLLYVKPAPAKTDETGKRYYATLECEGQMEQVVQFFYEVENSNLLLTIEKYALQPTSKGSSVVKSAATISRTAVR
jgi:Tfp pilus assembly protein PilO